MMAAPWLRMAGWVSRLVLGWALVCGLAGAQEVALPTQALPVQVLDSALATLTVDGVSARYPVRLPYHWDRLQAGKQGWADFEVRVDVASTPQAPWGLFIPRVGNAYEVWLNGALMQRSGDMLAFGGSDFAKIPRYVAMPVGLRAGSNALVVRIRSDIGRKGGLASMTLGPADMVYPLYYQAYRARGTGSLVVMIISLVVALAALTLWWTQVAHDAEGHAHRDPMYLVAAIGELAWSYRVWDAIVDNPPLPWVLWGGLSVAAWAVWAGGMAMFAVYAAGWHPRHRFPWLYHWLAVFVLTGVASAVLALGGSHAFVLTAWYATTFVLFFAFLSWYGYQALCSGSVHHRVMAAVLGINVVLGVYDLMMLRVSDTYGVNSLQRYSSVLFGVALAVIVFQRFRAASANARDLNRTLASQVAQKELELQRSYAQMEALARQQERNTERSRILRDMHDGVGMHLSMALRQVQSGTYEPPVVAGMLQEGLDQLKLSIDALNVDPGDVTALLANLRYRLEPRLRAAGIELQWLVDDIAPRAGLDDKGMRHLQFVVYEALANVLQHAQATTVVVQAHMRDDGLRLTLVDNGCGMDATQVQQRGLAAMRTRVLALGGTLNLRSEPGYTQIEVLLP